MALVVNPVDGSQTTEGLNADARKWTQMNANGPNGTARRRPASKPRAADAAARDGAEIAEAVGDICVHSVLCSNGHQRNQGFGSDPGRTYRQIARAVVGDDVPATTARH